MGDPYGASYNLLGTNAGPEHEITDSATYFYYNKEPIDNLFLSVGDVLSASVKLSSSDTTVSMARLVIQFRDSLDNILEVIQAPNNYGVFETWSKIENTTVPANTYSMDVFVVTASNSIGTVRAKRAILNRGPIALPYVAPFEEGATVGAPIGTNVGNVPASDVNKWSAITGDTKPADNATVGAPVGTDVAGVPAYQAVNGGVSQFTDMMQYANQVEFNEIWKQVPGILSYGELNFYGEPTAPGGKYVSIGNGSGDDMYWAAAEGIAPIPYDPNTLYEVWVVVKRYSGSGLFYCGLEGIAQDGVTRINAGGADSPSGQHYLAAQGITPPASQWTLYRGYVKGHSDTAGGYSPDPNNPGAMRTGTAFIRPMFIVNYNREPGRVGITALGVRPISGTLAAMDEVTPSVVNIPYLSSISQDVGEVIAGILRSSDSDFYVDLDNKYIQIKSGGYTRVIGAGFGVGNKFLEWYGVDRAINTMDTSNSIFHLTNTGDAYFGGNLSAGTLYNSITGTEVNVPSSTILGPFASNGGPITITASYSCKHEGYRGGSSSYSGSMSATIKLYKKVGGGAETLIWTKTVTGSMTEFIYESEFDRTDFQSIMSGSWTYTDNDQVVQAREYRIEVTTRSLFSVSGSASQADVIDQRKTLTSSE